MRYLILVLLPLLALLLQTTLFSSLAIQGTVPDMILIMVIFYAIFNGATKGTVYGAVCGLLEDLYLGRFIGSNAVSKGVTAYIIGRLQGNVFKENILVGVIGVIGGTLVNSFIILLLSIISSGSIKFTKFIVWGIGWELVYNLIITIPLYIWYYRSSRRGLLRETGIYK